MSAEVSSWMDDAPERLEPRVSKGWLWTTRVVALGLPLCLLFAAWADMDAWPATGWRLFSGLRHGTQVTWLVEVETVDGDAVAFDPAEDAEARGSWRHQLDRAITDPQRQRSLCEEWLIEAKAGSSDVTGLVIRRAWVDVPTDDGPSRVVRSSEVQRC